MNWGEFCQWGWHMTPWGMGWGWFGGIAMVVFWVAVIVGIVLLVRWLVTSPGQGQREETALEILKKRYARGEISREEFEEKKKDLM